MHDRDRGGEAIPAHVRGGCAARRHDLRSTTVSPKLVMALEEVTAQRGPQDLLIEDGWRLVDHEVAAREAKARLTAVRAALGYRNTSKQVFLRHGSRLRRPGPVEAGGAPVDGFGARPDPAKQLSLL